MSRVAPSSSALGQSRRIKANWTFQGTGQNSVKFSAFGDSQRSQSTTDARSSDANTEATPWWHETATLPTQPLTSKGSPGMQATRGRDSPTDQGRLSSSDEDQSQLPPGLQKKWRRPSGGLEEPGVTWQGGSVEQCRSHESMGRRSVGNDMTPLQYTIDCSPEVSTSSEDCTNDGVDSGLGSATTMFANQEIVDYMNQHLMHYMNPMALLPKLQQHHLLTEEDVGYIRSPHRSDEERKERILSAILLQEGDSIDRLVDCLSQETSHSGHKYLARRLREAVEKKQQHPDKPLSSLRLGSPPPSDGIKPRGAAAHRNSIARLLATKRNNVAKMISNIEAKESAHRSEKQQTPPLKSQPLPNQPAHLSPQHEQRERESSKQCKTTVEVQSNAVRSTPAHSQLQYVAPPESPPPTVFLPHSPQQTGIRNHALDERRSPSEDLVSPHHVPTPTQSSTPPHSLTPPHSQSPSSSTPFLSHTPPYSSQEDTPNSSPHSLCSTPKRRRPVNEMVIRRKPSGTSTPPNSPQLPNKERQAGPHEEVSRKRSDLTYEANARRKSLPEALSSPTPTSPKVPMLPPCSSPPAYVHPPEYTEEISENQLSPTSSLSPPDTTAEGVQKGSGRSPVTYRPRTTRLIGLTTRFHKHRRSASMSSCENRPSNQTDPLTDSLGVMLERSPFHHRRGKAEAGHQVRASLREGNEKLIKRRIEWLQERVHFSDCPEHIQFNSKTHYGEQRELLYSGTLHKHGNARFVVLFTDMLLVLKARRPTMPSRVFHFQSSRIDWFSDLEYIARKPLPLHLLTVQRKSSKQGNDSFCLHFNDHSKVVEVVLQAVSKEARDIWVEDLSEAIKFATSAHADTYILVGNKALRKNSGEPYKKLQLTIHKASNLGLAANCNSFSLFCVIEVGKQRCRTPSVMGGYNPTWNYQCEFTDFCDTDGLLIDVFSENIFRPNDFLGCVNIPLQSLPEEHSGRKVFEGSMVLAGLEEAYAGEIELTVEQGWETKM